MNFKESVKYLYALGNEVLTMKLGLGNISTLLRALGDPQNKYLKVQIAGTNGKGSTVAFLESICVAANIKVGATTSPHLVSVTERVRIDGAEISEEDFARHATRIRETAESLVETGELETVPTYFEQVTAIALVAFAEAEIELAILETGLGGRYDATTAARAELVAITPIDYDHQNILGNSLAEIAAEKAAIIRADTRVLVAPQTCEAEKVIYGKCREVGVEPIWAIPDVELIENLGGGLLRLNFKTAETNYKVDFGMQGKHQWTNANLAIRIAEKLHDYKFKISQEAIKTGLETAKHKGRLEFYREILFDGAHNVSGAKALREYLDEFVNQPITMIFGAMRDKDLTEIAGILFPKADKLILTVPDNPRSMETEKLRSFVSKDFSDENLYFTDEIAVSLTIAGSVSDENHLILVTGSLYLVGEVQAFLRKHEN